MIPVDLDHGCRTFHGLVEVTLCNITFNIGHFFTSVDYGNPNENKYANIYRLIKLKANPVHSVIIKMYTWKSIIGRISCLGTEIIG